MCWPSLMLRCVTRPSKGERMVVFSSRHSASRSSWREMSLSMVSLSKASWLIRLSAFILAERS